MVVQLGALRRAPSNSLGAHRASARPSHPRGRAQSGSLSLQDVFLQNQRVWAAIKAWFQFRPSSQYRKWQRRLERDPSWPPVNQREFAHGSKAYLNLSYHHGEDKY